MEVEYRILHDPVDFERMVDLEITVWGLDPRDAVPATMLRAIEHGSGLVNGAFMGDQLVGLGMMYPVPHGNRNLLWSHMTGVHPDYRQSGIGMGVKRHQRTWALDHGYDEIRWTFDPLQRGNANFNLYKLGVFFSTYLINFYGTMTDAINNGMPSDRVEAVWHLNAARVIALTTGQSEVFHEINDYPALLTTDINGLPFICGKADGHTPSYLVQIPNSLKMMGSNTVLAWRLALRETLTHALGRGYIAYDFDPEKSAYVLHKRLGTD